MSHKHSDTSSYYDDPQLCRSDVYHGNTDSNKENSNPEFVPYYDSRLYQPQTKSVFYPITPNTAQQCSLKKQDLPKPTKLSNQNTDSCSSSTLNVYRERDLFNRPEKRSVKSSSSKASSATSDPHLTKCRVNQGDDEWLPNKQRASKSSSSKSPSAESDLGTSKRQRDDENEGSLPISKRSRSNTKLRDAANDSKLNMAEGIAEVEPTFTPRTRMEGTVVLDNELLDDFSGMRKYWPTNQGTEQGMSAKNVMHAAGIDVDGVMWNILHLIAFSMGGYDGIEPNEVENFTNGTAGSNGFHLRIEDAIKALVRKHGPLYVHYSFEPQSDSDKKWRIGDFTYEFGLIKNSDLIADFRAGKIDADQIRGECVNSTVIRTLDKRYSSPEEAQYLYAAGDVVITRLKEKQREGTGDPVPEIVSTPQKFNPSWFLSQSSGGLVGYVPGEHTSPTTRHRYKDKLGSPLQPIYVNGSPVQAMTKDGEKLHRSSRTRAIHIFTRNATELQLCKMRSAQKKIDFEQIDEPMEIVK